GRSPTCPTASRRIICPTTRRHTMEPEGVFRRRRLPHWDVPGATYFVTTCLAGSIPTLGLLDINNERERLDRLSRPDNISAHEWDTRRAKLLFTRTDEWLDQRPGVRWLQDERLAKILVESINHFAGTRYDVWAYIITPSHIHWVFRPTD